MKKLPDYRKVDKILNLFYGYYPYGTNYFTLTYKLKLEADEWEEIFDFLLDEEMIEEWGEDDKYKISEKAIIIINRHCGIERYIRKWGKIQEPTQTPQPTESSNK